MDVTRLRQSDTSYPPALSQYLGKDAPFSIAILGDLQALKANKLALFCSVWNKPVYTFSHASNENLIALGARPLMLGEGAQIGLGADKRSED